MLNFFRALCIVFTSFGLVSISQADTKLPFYKGAGDSSVPKNVAISAFAGDALYAFPSDYADGPAKIGDRVSDGFQAAPSSLKLTDGSSISWGFKYQEPYFESFVIADSENEIRLIAAVTNIVRLTGYSSGPIKTMAEYENAVKASMVDGSSVILFVRDEKFIANYMPLVRRWIQADLLGFNVDCGSQKLAQVCQVAEKIEIPIMAYRICESNSGKQKNIKQVAVPAVKAADIPIKLFQQ
jgi:hypothetical protein